MTDILVSQVNVSVTVGTLYVGVPVVMSLSDVAASVSVGGVAVNENVTTVLSDVAVSVAVGTPTVYYSDVDTASKAANTLPHIPVADGYSVTPVADFSGARYDGGASLFRTDRRSTQQMWRVKASFVFSNNAEYAAAMDIFMAGIPFETDLVIDLAPSLGDLLPGQTYVCWALTESISLDSATYDGFGVSLEMLVTEAA